VLVDDDVRSLASDPLAVNGSPMSSSAESVSLVDVLSFVSYITEGV